MVWRLIYHGKPLDLKFEMVKFWPLSTGQLKIWLCVFWEPLSFERIWFENRQIFQVKLADMAGLKMAFLPTLNISFGFHYFLDLVTLMKSLYHTNFRPGTLIHRKTGQIFKVKMKTSRSPILSTNFVALTRQNRHLVYIFWARNSKVRNP